MISSSAMDVLFAPETSTNVCSCGVKHDEFVTSVGTFQFCDEQNLMLVLEYPDSFCDREHREKCTLQHPDPHKHTYNSGKHCVMTTVVDCDAIYTGGIWKRVANA